MCAIQYTSSITPLAREAMLKSVIVLLSWFLTSCYLLAFLLINISHAVNSNNNTIYNVIIWSVCICILLAITQYKKKLFTPHFRWIG